MPFDINMKDVAGQNALYTGCQIGNQRLIDTLLKYQVVLHRPSEGSRVELAPATTRHQPLPSSESEQKLSDPSNPSTSPNKRRVSEGIQGIISKLSIVTNQNLIASKRVENMVCPIDVNAYCEDYQTPLHVAVKQRNHVIATMLLNAKADANLPIHPSPNSCGGSSGQGTLNRRNSQNKNKRKEDSSSALVEGM